jgi:hypothetical protein
MALGRSPLDMPIRGNLRDITTSLEEIAEACRDWIIDKVLDKAVDGV